MTLEPKWLQKVKFTCHLAHTTEIKKNREGNKGFKNASISAVGLVVSLRFDLFQRFGLVRMTARRWHASISAVGMSL